MLAFVIFAVTFLVALLGGIIWLYPGSKKVTTIPGLDATDPKDGNLGEISKAGSLHEFLVQLHADWGKIASFWLGQQLVVSIASPQLFKEHSKVFNRPPELYASFEPLLRKGSIQYANGAEGRKRRNLLDPVYSHENVSREYLPIFLSIVDNLAKKWSSVPREEHLPLTHFMFALAIKSIAEASYGSFFENDKQVLELKNAYEICFAEMESRLGGDVPDSESERQKRFDENNAVIEGIMKQALTDRKKSKKDDALLIDKLIGSPLSHDVIMADAVTYFVAGFHTTGYMMTWAIYFLASHQDVQEKCYTELIGLLDDEPLNADAINQLPYMRQVLDETLRCSILAPYAARVQDIDTELGGHKLPAGTPVLHALGVLLQDEKLWPEPTKFDPERFSPENRKEHLPFQFEPFGFAGKRKCPGYRFSYMEGTVFLSVLLRKFTFSLVPGQTIVPEYGIVTKPRDEIWVTINKR